MKIGILGAGRIGGTLGKRWADKGHEVFFGVRDASSDKVQALMNSIGPRARAGSVGEAAAFGEIILLAVPWASAQEVVQQAGDLTGKVLIDATNRMVSASPGSASMAEDVARWAAGAKVVKAFNSSGFANYADSKYGAQNVDNYLCGDDPEGKRSSPNYPGRSASTRSTPGHCRTPRCSNRSPSCGCSSLILWVKGRPSPSN